MKKNKEHRYTMVALNAMCNCTTVEENADGHRGFWLACLRTRYDMRRHYLGEARKDGVSDEVYSDLKKSFKRVERVIREYGGGDFRVYRGDKIKQTRADDFKRYRKQKLEWKERIKENRKDEAAQESEDDKEGKNLGVWCISLWLDDGGMMNFGMEKFVDLTSRDSSKTLRKQLCDMADITDEELSMYMVSFRKLDYHAERAWRSEMKKLKERGIERVVRLG